MSLWPPTAAAAGEPSGTSAFVGRAAEVAELDAAWAAARRGRRQVVFVGGDPGAGKTRLVAEAVARWDENAGVLLGRCIDDLGPAYQPFVEPLTRILEAAQAGALALEHGDELARVATLVGTAGVGAQAGSRRAFYDAVVHVLWLAADVAPLALVLEDFHWASDTTLELLSHIVRHTGDAQLLVLVTHRSARPDRSASLVSAVADMFRFEGVGRIDLGPLDVDSIADYVTRETGAEGARARVAATLLRDHTGGNPFFLREMLREALAHGGLERLDPRSMPTPASVRDILEQRLDRIPVDSRKVLEAAAITGATASVAVVAQAMDRSPQDVLNALDDAARLGFLDALPATNDEIRFVHTLARQAVLDLTDAGTRARLHAAVGSALESHFPAAPDRVQRMAHHFSSAHVLGFSDKAVDYLVEAARQARARLAHGLAAELLERAAGLAHELGQRDRYRLEAATARCDAGDIAASLALNQRVWLEGGPVDRLRAAIAYEESSWRIGAPGEAALHMLTSALAECGLPDGEDLTVLAQAHYGRALGFAGAAEHAAAVAARTIDAARASGSADLLAQTLCCATCAIPTPANARILLDWSEELERLLDQIRWSNHPVCTNAHYMAAYLLGRADVVERAYAEVGALARRSGSTFLDFQVGCYRWARSFTAADLDEAAAVNRLLRDPESSPDAGLSDRVSIQTFLTKRERGELEPVRALVTGDEALADHWLPGLLALYVELRLVDPAHRLLRHLLDGDLRSLRRSATWPATLAFMAEAADALEDVESAREVLHELTDYRGCHLAVASLSAVFGSADRLIGQLESMLSLKTAGDVLAGGIDADRAMHAPLFVGYGRVAVLRHLQRAGAPRREIDGARAAAVADASLLHVPRLLAAIGGPPSQAPDGLTRREVEVLRLLGQGLSNRELAARLVISENTATNHVRSILMKTGAENRTQAAMYAVANGLLPPAGHTSSV
ncbi:MAG: AAA family ATPase [Dermatophilaceae bacterium]